jgi:hypothetical protein
MDFFADLRVERRLDFFFALPPTDSADSADDASCNPVSTPALVDPDALLFELFEYDDGVLRLLSYSCFRVYVFVFVKNPFFFVLK